MTENIKLSIAMIYWVFLCLRGKHKKNMLILYYHGVLNNEKESFHKQMSFIANHSKTVSIADINTTNTTNNGPIVTITFDDAFENLLYNALPAINKYRIPTTIFVPSGNLGDYPKWNIAQTHPDKTQKVMTKKQIQDLSDTPNIEIGSHTVSHPYLTNLNEEDLKRQLTESKAFIENIIGKPINSISYPHGDYNDNVILAAKQAGYTYGYTVEPKNISSNQILMTIPRYAILPTDSIFKIKLILSGAFEVDYFLRKLKNRISKLIRLK